MPALKTNEHPDHFPAKRLSFDFWDLAATMAAGGDAMQLVGIRDLKNKLAHYLETAKKGDAIIITDRGTPVAILHNLDQIEENDRR
jgi:prevent-host-death family protein